MFEDPGMKDEPVRATNKQRINVDYLHKKKPRQITPLPAMNLDAGRNAGNPNPTNARVLIRDDETMGVSVYVAGDPYHERYPIGATTLTDAQLRKRIT